jgi:hypothetical protein
MKKIFIAIIAVLTLFQSRVVADEGMWLLSLVEKMNMDEMQEMGLQLTSEQIYSVNNASLKDAIGALDYGSCTAELVSPDGLLLTNHHCGYDEIQYHSSVEHDYLKNGFWAMTREEELPNEGKTITFLVRMEEVTSRISSELNEKMNHQTRNTKIRSLSNAIAREAIGDTEYDAAVYSMYNENRFFLFVTETYRDIRLVGAPPESIGSFGGGTDNWQWPRHTCDFSMFRVYTGPDGEPADYSPDNIPLRSKYYLPISLKGYKMDDFTMVMGFPGKTDRYITSWEVEELLEITHPNRIRIRGIKQELQMEDMMADEKVRIQYSAKHQNSSNYWKYSIGQSKGLEDLKIADNKRKLEEEFTRWISLNEARREMYGGVLEDIRLSVEERRELQYAAQYLEETIRLSDPGMESVQFARNLEILERVLVYADEYPDDLERVTARLKDVAADFYKDYNPPTDKKVMAAMIRLMIEDLDDRYLPFNILEIKEEYKGNVDKYVGWYFKKSMVVDQNRFFAFLDKPSLKVLRKDPAYVANQASKIYLEITGQIEEINKKADRGSRLYLKGIMEMNSDRDYYSDANSTMRINYGSVGDYYPRDAVKYNYYTTLSGVMEKEDPDHIDFVVPEKLKELYAEKDYGPYGTGDKLMVCFTSDNDITGGNSGSPVINSTGELIGLAFDGNWEAMSGDIAFEPELQKCINVDIRYILFIIDKYAGAGHLVEEMNLIR